MHIPLWHTRRGWSLTLYSFSNMSELMAVVALVILRGSFWFSWGVSFPFWILFLVHINSVTHERLLVFPPLLKIHVTSHIPNLLRPPTSLPFLLSVLKNMFINCLCFHSFRPLGCLSVKTWDFTKASHGNCFLCLTLFLNLIVTDSTACLVLSLQSQGGNFPVHRSLSITH